MLEELECEICFGWVFDFGESELMYCGLMG